MQTYTSQQFKNQTFVMEECYFVNCVLTECELFYSGGDVEWVNLQMVNCRWHFRGFAQKTIQTLQNIGMLKVQQTPPQSVSTSKLN